MTVLSLKIPTERDLVLAYQKTDIASKTLIDRQIAKILEKILFPERQKAMYALMASMSQEAEDNGLTDALIDEILNEHEWFVCVGLNIPVTKEVKVCRDPNDDMFLSLALATQANCIITEDKDMLVMNPFEQIPIVSISDFLRHF